MVVKEGLQGGKEVENELIGYAREMSTRHKQVTKIGFVEQVPKSARGEILN